MTTLRIDCGGDGYAQEFQGDNEKYIIGDKVLSHVEANDLQGLKSEVEARVLKSHRWCETDFLYEIPVEKEGDYEVELWFAEVWDGAFENGRRVFSVQVRGDDPQTPVIDHKDIDVYAAVGANALLSKKGVVKASRTITISLIHGSANHPMISGITILSKTTTTDPPTSKYPTTVILESTKKKIDEYGRKIENRGIPLRGSNKPYYMFHPSSYKPHGTVLFFHGFSGANYGQRILVKYLYDSGFNVVSCILAGHPYAGEYWPQVHISEKCGGRELERKLKDDRVVMELMGGRRSGPSPGTGELTMESFPKLLDRAKEIEPKFRRVSVEDYLEAINDDTSSKFDDIFESTHMEYLTVAQEQLELIGDMPGDVFTCGLSVGGAVAIGLAAQNPGRIKMCFSATPLLELFEKVPNTTRMLVNVVGPLGLRDFGWSADNRFPMSNLTAAGRFGGFVTSDVKGIDTFKSGKCHLFLCLTELEDAADIPTNRKYFDDIGGTKGGHEFYIYPRDKRVPHPLVDPTQLSQGTSNRYYRSLYAEIYRFFTQGKVKNENMDKMEVNETGIPRPPEGVAGWHNYRDT